MGSKRRINWKDESFVCPTCGHEKPNPDYRQEAPPKKGSVCERCFEVVEDPMAHGLNYCPLRARGVGFSPKNEAMERARFYKKTIAREGVKGRDLIQPYTKDGKPNPDFLEHYPRQLKEFPPETRADIENKYGKN